MEIRPPSRICRLLTNPSPSLPEQIFRRDFAIGEDHFAGVAGAQSELIFFFPGLEAGSALFDDERRDAVAFLCGVGDRHTHADVRVMAIGGEGFRAVDDPGAVFSYGLGARAAGVGTGFRLGERPAAELFALRQRGDVFLFLFFAAEFVDVIGAERIVRGHDDADGAIHARQVPR